MISNAASSDVFLPFITYTRHSFRLSTATRWYSASVPVIIHVISYNIGPRYNGTRLYIWDYYTVVVVSDCVPYNTTWFRFGFVVFVFVWIVVFREFTWTVYPYSSGLLCTGTTARIIFCMCPANGRRRYIVTSSLIGWAHTEYDLCYSYEWSWRVCGNRLLLEHNNAQ